MTMHNKTLQEFVNKTTNDCRIFAVEFIKRSNGELRRMICRTGVKKGTKGGSMGYNPIEHDLLSVYDMNVLAFRSIPIENIKHLTLGGRRYKVDNFKLIEEQKQ